MPYNQKRNVDWLEDLSTWYAFHNVITLRPELPIFIIQWDGEKELRWMDLSDPNNLEIKPYHFETYFGKQPIRDAHYIEALKEAASANKIVVKELFGSYDLFCPLPIRRSKNEKHAFLYAGQFLKEHATWEYLAESWRNLTGQEPASANRDFVHFVRMCLTLPVFGTDLLDSLKQFFTLFAQYLSQGDADFKIRDGINKLNDDQFATLWPIRDWIDSVISPNKFLPPPWHYEGELTEWMKIGMGINQLPTTAMTLMPMDSQTDLLDPVQTLLRNAMIQRECITFSRDLPETTCTKLQDYGVSIVTVNKSGKSAARARLELRECAQKFRTFILDKFNTRTVVGIGRSMSPGSRLHESHREAVLALHMCVQLEKDILFYDEHGGGEKFKYAQLQKSADKLLEALDRESSTALKLACDRYVQFVLRYANQRIEVVRGQFLATLFQMFNTVQRRNPMRTDARDTFINELTNKLEEARSMDQAIESFNDALQRLSFVSTKAWRGPSVMLLEATLQYLRENFFEPLPLPEVARKAGFSVPVFTRVFKQATGTSYLSYLRSIRIEHAKKLLSTTMLTLEQIAQACGFHSQHHLIRSFKKVTNMTPGAYRKNHTTLHVEP